VARPSRSKAKVPLQPHEKATRSVLSTAENVGFSPAATPVPRNRSAFRPPSSHCLDRQRDTLAAAYAKGDDSASQVVAAHRMNKASRKNGTGSADRMAMGYRAAFDIDDLLGQTEFARHNDGNGGKRFIDFDALY
jgi:hypothetical protein